MEESLEKNILEKAPLGYAYHKIILDENDSPIDYKFIHVNDEFENITTLDKEDLINKTAREIDSEVWTEFNYPDLYSKVALNNQEKEFEQYSHSLNKYLKFKVYSPKKQYFVTTFKDITPEIEISQSSQKFLEQTQGEIDYQAITDDLLRISDAKYIAFNKFLENGKDFRTVAISGVNQDIKKGLDILGFNPIGKQWDHDPVRAQKIAGQITTYFDNLRDLTGQIIPKPIVKTIEEIFNLGQTAVVKITKQDTMLGDFTIMMPNSRTLKHQHLIEAYAQQVGLYLDKRQAEKELKASEEKYRLMVNSFQDGIVIIQDQTFEYVNHIFANMIELDKEDILGSEPNEIFTEDFFDKLEHFLLKHKNDSNYNFETKLIKSDESKIDVRIQANTIDYQGQEAIFATIRDITREKEIINKLKNQNGQGQKLDEFIPICAGCNRIRDREKEDSPWVSPGEYINERLPEVKFTHGICPRCRKELYPDLNRD